MAGWSVSVIVLLALLGAAATVLVAGRSTPAAEEGVWPSPATKSWWKRYGAAVITLATGLATAAVSAFLGGFFTPPESADCAGQINQVIAVVSSHPDLWIPIDASNEGERQCHLNEVAARVLTAK